MSRWFRFYDAALDDPKVQRLPAEVFRAAVYEAARGGTGPMAKFMKPSISDRVSSREWAAVRSFVFERDNFTCSYCGKRGGRLECDHIQPVSKGGDDSLGNLTTACRPCNRAKGARTPEDWLQ